MDLILPAPVVARCFAAEQAKLERLEAEADAAAQALADFVGEHSGEEGLLAEATDDSGKVSKDRVKKLLKEFTDDPEDVEEREALRHYLKLADIEAEAKKRVRDAQTNLCKKVLATYNVLNEADIKNLVVADKWLTALEQAIEDETRRCVARLATRMQELEERYAEPLPRIEQEVETHAAKVAEHLKKMGVTW